MSKSAYIPPINLYDRHLIFVDCETTGISPSKHGICSLAAIRVDPKTWEILTDYETFVRPYAGCEYDEGAMKVNRISMEDIENAPTERDVMTKFLSGTKDCVALGYNIDFDWRFITKAVTRNGLDPEQLPYHVIDVMSMCWPLVNEGHLTSLSLQSVCAYLKVLNKGQHSAIVDVMRTFKVFKKMMERNNAGKVGY